MRLIFQRQDRIPHGFSRWLGLIVSIILFVINPGIPMGVGAQGDETLLVLPPDYSAFPILSTQIKPLNQVSGATELLLEDLTVVENGQSVPVVGLEKQLSGVHFSLAINGDRRLDVRDADGISPYDRIRAVLSTWAGARRFGPEDRFSLVTQESAAIRNTPEREVWIQALEAYQPNFRTMTPDLTSLETALQLSSERVVPFGVDKALLYITPPPTPQEIIPILTLTEEAISAGIQVSVWMLGEDFFLSNEQGGSLIELAARTGGEFFHYTGVEAIPDPEVYLEALGIYYNLSFESGIRKTGTYTFRVIADSPAGAWQGESGEFYIDVQPPKPILLSPPAVILRQPPGDWEGDLGDLEPASQEIEFILEFPDRYPRALVASRLYVDGRLVDQRSEPPFDTLTWDLTLLVESGEFTFQVAVEDTLGLSGETILTPIQVEVQLPEPEPPLSSQQVGTIVIGVILTAAVILLIIWSTGHFLQGAFAQRIARKIFDTRQKPGLAGMNADDQAGGVYATLLPLNIVTPNWEHTAIPITRRQTAFGSDPKRVDQVLDGEDIDELHARLRVKDGEFWISDAGSGGGTWVNYALIGRDPVPLHPGDLIHFGSTGFRFTIIDSASPPKATVSKYQPIL